MDDQTKSVKFSFWLVFATKEGRYSSTPVQAGSPRTAQKKPALGVNEVAVKMSVDLPETLFSKPTLNFKLAVPAPENEVVIDAEAQTRIADVLAEQLGVKVVVSAGDTAQDA